MEQELNSMWDRNRYSSPESDNGLPNNLSVREGMLSRLHPWGSGRISLLGVLGLALVLGFFAGSKAEAQAIAGRVVDDLSGDPIPNVVVSVEGQGQGMTDDDGRYRVVVESSGSYFVLIETPPEGYLGQLFSGIACFSRRTFAACPISDGTAVLVGDGETVTGIDFSLQAEAQITGRVTDQDSGDPLEVEVNLYWAPNPVFGTEAVLSTISGPDGTYRFVGLPEAEFFVATNAGPYQDEIYDDIPCGTSCDPGTGTAIPTTMGQVQAGIDIALSLESRIEGNVTVNGGSPLATGAVWLFSAQGNFLGFSLLDEVGGYFFQGLDSGTYFVRTSIGGEWVDEVYDNRFCPQLDGTCDVTEGTPLIVSGGEARTGIDFELVEGARISGKIRAAEDDETLFASVDAYSATGERVRTTSSNDMGDYELSGLAPGTYYIATRSSFGFLSQLYNGMPCGEGADPTCDVTQGTPITVGLGDSVDGIDFALEAEGTCVPSSTRLCLNGGRFAVDIDWMTRSGDTGLGQAVDLTFADDSGYFWFFNESNVEVIVKVLDACGTSFNSYWVFAAGLTNVEVNLTVTDTLTGDTQAYVNPVQTPFEPVLDTSAFETCDAAPAGDPLVAPLERTLQEARVSSPSSFLGPPSRAQVAAPTTGTGACVPGESVLCLRGGRFQVEAIWEQADGNSGPASAEVLTDDTGFFWFFNPDNVEMVVKVLNNCNGSTNRFWVFAGGQTNLGVNLRVTDTETGEVNTYVNPQQTPFQPVQDTDAFDSCPAQP